MTAATNGSQVFVASTMFGLATVVAALDSGLFPAAGERILVCSNNAQVPETTLSVPEMAGFGALSRRFDRVVQLNEAIAPLHPAEWSPRAVEAPTWERYLRQAWGLTAGPLRLVVESIQASPAQVLCRIFPDATIDVYADGLMSYGPTRTALPAQVGSRVSRLLHLDLVPGLEPLLLSEWAVPSVTIPGERFLGSIDELSGCLPLAERGEPVALILGQYLSALGLITEAEEEQLYLDMLVTLAELGHRTIYFKPHPGSSRQQSLRMEAEGERLGVSFRVVDEPWLAEYLFARLDVERVVSCFSTALLTARTLYGIEVAQLGAVSLLDRLTPYENSNRIPATLVSELVPVLGSCPEPGRSLVAGPRLTELVGAVAYAMQPALHPGRRAAAESFLAEHFSDSRQYFKRRRLTKLQLPGALPRLRRSRLTRVLRTLRRGA